LDGPDILSIYGNVLNTHGIYFRVTEHSCGKNNVIV